MINPLISIITVTYNAEKYIAQTMQSVLNQTYPNIEYLIIDGGSTDRTLEIIKNYELKIKFQFRWISEKDNGIYDAMNKGIALASGSLIGILNASDYYEPNAVETVVNAYSHNCDAGIFHGNMNMLNENGTFFKQKKPNTNLDELYKGMRLWHPSFFVAKPVYEKQGLFDTQFKIAADFDFALRCYLAGVKFVYIDTVITHFRKGGVSSKREIEAHKECKAALIKNNYPDHVVNAVVKQWKKKRRKNAVYYAVYQFLNHLLPSSLVSKIATRLCSFKE